MTRGLCVPPLLPISYDAIKSRRFEALVQEVPTDSLYDLDLFMVKLDLEN